MTHARAWRTLAFCGCGACGVLSFAHSARAAPSDAASELDPGESPSRVEVTMIGDVERDPLLFERIRSLFPSQTAVLLSEEHRLDQRAVLLPQRVDTVYVWIRVTELSDARVYLALAERGAQVRYLFRQTRLESGLDEVGGETLAQIAHSSARALWLHEQQSSREAVVNALQKEAPIASSSVPKAEPPPVAINNGAAPVKDERAPTDDATRGQLEPSTFRLGLGVNGTTHSSGSEGFLQELGVFFGFEYRGRFSLRAAARYLLPADFDVPPAAVHLTGGSGELRAGWSSSDARRLRVRLEGGLGALLGRAQSTIVDEQPKAHALSSQTFQRAYALAAAGLEFPFGPAWVAASLDVRVPLGSTSYEVAGQAGAVTSASLCPGGSLEVGVGFDPAPR